MHITRLAAAGIVAILLSAPAFADDAVDIPAMVETSSSHIAIDPVDLPAGNFDLSTHGGRSFDFMATMRAETMASYALEALPNGQFGEDIANPAALFVEPEFTFRSNAQDSGVDAVEPGRFKPSSVRNDYLTDAGPAGNDKSSFGFRVGF